MTSAAGVLAFDHYALAVKDLDEASQRLFDEHGLASVPGGTHAGHGTGNRIVPLGSDYLELIAVVDPDEAKDSPLGQRIAAPAWVEWAGEPDRLADWLREHRLDIRSVSGRSGPGRLAIAAEGAETII